VVYVTSVAKVHKPDSSHSYKKDREDACLRIMKALELHLWDLEAKQVLMRQLAEKLGPTHRTICEVGHSLKHIYSSYS
jgi:hypothetical protein